jgi:hypothetical protein
MDAILWSIIGAAFVYLALYLILSMSYKQNLSA